jgi:Mg2+ and Co2+ transporter CorA
MKILAIILMLISFILGAYAMSCNGMGPEAGVKGTLSLLVAFPIAMLSVVLFVVRKK